MWKEAVSWQANLLGRDGSIFRAVNLLTHLLTVFLVMWVARRWGAHTVIAMAAALLWTTHPSMPEAVCWSSDIYDLMATTFMLLALGIVGSQPRPHHRLLMGLLVLCACLCKESSLALVPVLVILSLVRQGIPHAIRTGIAVGMGGSAFWLLHRKITAQGYMDALDPERWQSIVDAGLMLFGWVVYAPPRAPMAPRPLARQRHRDPQNQTAAQRQRIGPAVFGS